MLLHSHVHKPNLIAGLIYFIDTLKFGYFKVPDSNPWSNLKSPVTLISFFSRPFGEGLGFDCV